MGDDGGARTGEHGGHTTVPGPLAARALTRESEAAWQAVATGRWRPAPADAEAAAAVLARLTAPLPDRRGRAARQRAADRDRRLQRVLRTTLHHLDAGAVSPPAAALLAALARALLPWHAAPNPPPAAAAPRYTAGPGGTAPPTDAGEALLPGLTALFTALAATGAPGTAQLTPPAAPRRVRYAGRFRRHARPAPGVWTAETVRCPACGATDGPWAVTCDWRRVTLGCPCGAVTDRHGLALSEVWLVLPDA
ncbi:hypothetical protein E2C00_18445 [Streptomyces sp. WAC05374]|uniref:hypothetical protein n=1 Tax=Streptomyces sp. WAC05374 TaxID=2487420 RepID=UPI00105515A4|nr:hypothetical protein [Streptomyces sp. WAC05374]TDF47859.1 hypothetical protein E2C02_29390 [Streptomyces sp. WAC05374]TDF53990.1 hypothetical protein E2C00_18445 [Streptomyces sp. WAC05374]